MIYYYCKETQGETKALETTRSNWQSPHKMALRGEVNLLTFLWTTKVVLSVWTTKWEMGTTKWKIGTTNTLTNYLTAALVCASRKIHE